MNAVIRSLTDSLRSTLRTSGSVRRRRLASAFQSSAVVDVLEARLLLAADMGDAPDPSAATGLENYQTTVANNGPRHTIDQTQTTLFLGAGVDGDAAAQQSSGALGDDLFAAGGRDDEDGILSPFELQATVGTNPVVTIEATNTTGRTATLFGWIDLNRNGIFENTTERAQVTVPSGTDHQRVSLTFPLATVGSIGKTYARFRLSTDAASANSTGLASDGEVEDYRFTIQNRIAFPLSIRSSITLGQQINQPSENWPLTFLGFGIAPIGDLDQNGVQDFVVTDPADGGDIQPSGPQGAAYVVFQNLDGTVKQSVKIASDYNGGPPLSSDSMFGLSVTTLGDIDGDGVTDLAIGAHGDDTGGTERGAVYIVRLKPDGTAKSFTKIAHSLNGGPVLHDQDGFGMFLTSPGDIDGDGIVDLIVAATNADVGGANRGEIFTMFLKPDGTVRNFTTIQNTSQWNPTIEEEETFGFRIKAIGDINGDGVPDLASLSSSNINLGEQIESIPKQIDILLMNSDGTLKKFVGIGDELNGGPDLATNDAIWDLTSVGDVDGDGVEDLAVVIGDFDGEGQSRLLVLTLTPEGRAKSSQQMSLGYAADLSSLTNLGDTNNDGRIELAWGIPLDGGSVRPRGVVQIKSLENAAIRTSTPTVPVIDRTVTQTRNPRPTISWNDGPDESGYEVWIRNEDSGVVVVSSAVVITNSYTPPVNLVPGRYAIAVRARNEIGMSAWSARYQLSVHRVAQINPIATSMNSKPEISWNKLGENSRYEVWISKASTPGTALIRTTTEAGATRYLPTTSLAAGNYRVQVREVTGTSTFGLWSEPRDFTVATKAVITRVSGQISNRPLIEWENLAGAKKFDVWIASLDQPSRPAIRVTTTTAVTSFRPAALPAGRYQVWVRGIAMDDKPGEWSAGKSFRSQMTPELKVGSGQLVPGERISFSWTLPEEAQSYDVWIDDPASGLTPASSIVRTSNKSSEVDLTSVGKYRIWVRAINADGTVGAWSPPLTLTVNARPSGLNFVSSNVNQPDLRWQSVPGADFYEIRVATTESNAVVITEVANSSVNPTTTYRLTNSLPIGNYQISVRAIAPDRSAGAWSDAMTYNSNLGPSLSTVHPGLESGVKLQWTAAANSGPINFSIMDLRLMRIVYSGSAPASSTSAVVELGEGDYRWWAMSTTHGMWSLPGEFTVKRTTQFSSDTYFQTGRIETLSWEEVEIAHHYDIWITNDRGVIVYRNQNVSGVNVTLPNTLPAGYYRAWVRVVTETGAVGQWSGRLDFELRALA